MSKTNGKGQAAGDAGATWRGLVKPSMMKHYSLSGAEAFIGKLRPGETVLGVTNGQFSLSDVVECIADWVGNCELDIATWTAAGADAARMIEIAQSGRVSSMRWMVDNIFIKRQPGLVKALLKQFGKDSIRITKTHAKFAVFQAAVAAGLFVYAAIGIALSAVGAYYYLRIVKTMYFDEPAAAFAPVRDPVEGGLIAASTVFLSPLGYFLIPALGAWSALAAEALF